MLGMKHQMHNKQLFIIIVLLALIGGCVAEKEYIVESDYSYDGNFKRYRTFDFINDEGSHSIYNHELIEKTMLRRLGTQGYIKSEEKPDLVISYKIYHENFDFGGFNQPNFEKWVGKKSFIRNEDSISISEQNAKTTSNNINDENNQVEAEKYIEQFYRMNEGTLFIAFYDRRRKKTIWQGYASGVFAKTDRRSTKSVYLATSKIFDEFRLIANGFLIE